MTALHVTAIGLPIGQGRVSFMGKGRAVHSNAERLLPWRDTVAAACNLAATEDGWVKTTNPVHLSVGLFLPRPKGHTGKKGLLPSAPTYPATRPDLDHLVRAIGDAISTAGCVWGDDSQVVSLVASKNYSDQPRAEITVICLGDVA